MKAHTASLINGLVLIGLSLWGYFSSDTPSVTALIPAIIGFILLLCNKGVQRENKIIAHVAVLLTLLVLFGLIKPLMGALDRNDNAAVARVLVMVITTIFAIISFVKSFIDARKKRTQN